MEQKRWIFPITSCNTDWTSNELIRVKEYTYPYRISDFYYFSPEEVNDIKKAVYYDMPITVGFKLTDSFDDLMKSGNTSSNSITPAYGIHKVGKKLQEFMQ